MKNKNFDLKTKKQLILDLKPKDPFSPSYFVPHSGVIEAMALFEKMLEDLFLNPSSFKTLYIYGKSGSGKTHLLNYFLKSKNLEESSINIKLIELKDSLKEDEVFNIVSSYDLIKSSGGLLVFTSRVEPHKLTSNPHALSRFLTASIVSILRPKEEELEMIFRSFMQRRNLEISKPGLKYLLNRIPNNFTSFSDILDLIYKTCFSKNVPAKRAVIKDVIKKKS